MMGQTDLPATGERMLPSMRGTIVLEHLHRYAIAADLAGGRDVLDIASGEGYGSHLLAAKARSVIGVDISPEAVRDARARYVRANLEFLEGCCTAIPLPDASVDMVVSFETIEHIGEHERFLAEVARVLRKDGCLLISTPHRENYNATLASPNPFHQRELSPAEFEVLLRRHFSNVQMLGQRTVRASVVLGEPGIGVQRQGAFAGDFASADFSSGLRSPVFLLALCSNAPLPTIPVGHFELKGRASGDPHWPEVCEMQIFADHGAGYTEELSARRPLVRDSWQCVRFDHIERLHTDRARRLRVDLVNQPALVEVRRIRIIRESSGETIFDASSADDFRQIGCSVGTLTYFRDDGLVLLATDNDPQLYLPLIDLPDETCTLEVELCPSTALPPVLRRLHHAEAEIPPLRRDAEALRHQISGLEAAISAANERHAKLDAALTSLRAENVRRGTAIASLQAEVARRDTAMESLRNENVRRENDSDALRRALDAARAELHGIRASWFWRLTTPLRWLGSLGRKLARSVGKRAAEFREMIVRLRVRFAGNAQLRRLRRDRELLARSGLIDSGWYFSRHPDAAYGRPDAALHYLRSGASRGFAPCALFDTRWYLERNPDVANAGRNPLVHFLLSGAQEGRAPTPLFDVAWYLEENPDVAAAGENPLVHYLRCGAGEGRNPNPFFDSNWYLAQNPDVAASGANPLAHFLEFGWREGRSPGPHFDLRYYLEAYPDVALKGANPLVHFISYGWSEGRAPNARFEFRSGSPRGGNAHSPGIKPLLDYLDRHAGFACNANGGMIPRAVDWDQFYRLPREIGWRETLAALPDERLPKLSIVMPVHRTPPHLLARAVHSVAAQEYTRWELCIVDDGSNEPSLRAWLEAQAGAEPRIKLAVRAENRGISAATNDALALCTGDFVALLDHDDELTPDALGEFAALLVRHPDTDAAYSDQDKTDEHGRCREPFHKPAWSPVFFLGVMYVGHLLVVRRTLLEKVGGCDPRFDRVQDYDLMLRISEATDRIRHLPKILYHWRATAGSIASSPSAKGSIEELQVAAVTAHLRRRGVAARAVSNSRHAHRVLLEPAPEQPVERVSIVIPTTADSPLLIECLASIVEKTTHSDYEILLMVGMGAGCSAAREETLAAAREIPRVRVVEYEFPFNFSKVNNHAASLASGALLLFLNDDTRVITPDWLGIMAAHLALPGVGAVGSKLLFPDGTVQHAGVVLGFRGTADHVMRGFPNDADGYFGSLSASREVSAVTGACLMLRAETYRSLGGMRECFASIYQDVDLCLRIRESGLSILHVANVELEHRESATRGSSYDHLDREILIDRWRGHLAADPFYSTNFTRNRHDYTLRRNPA